MRRLSILILLALALPAISAHAGKGEDKAVQKTLKTLVNAIRYQKYSLATKQLAYGSMSESLMGDHWKSINTDEQKEITSGLRTIIEKSSFINAHGNFKYLDALLFEPVRVSGKEARCKSTIVIHRALKKTEMVIDWVLTLQNGKWRVLDTVLAGESTMEVIREDEVEPLIEEGGVKKVIEALRHKVSSIKKS